jgi:F-type H+-transporting ATPase subunit b
MTVPMLALLLAAEGEGGGAGPFSVNFGLTFWTLIVFGIFLFFFRKTFWATIVARAEEREETIARQLSQAELANAEAKALFEKHIQLLAASRAEAQSMLAEAKTAAEKERQAALEKTRHEQEALLDRARRDVAAEKDKAIVELRREAVDLALAAAAKVIGQRLDSADDRRMVMDYLAKVETTH